MNHYLQTAIESINDADKTITNLQQQIGNLEKELKEERKLAEESITNYHSIKLAGGIINVDLSGLNYMTRESFKTWCHQHAITNSEPLFNL